MGNYPARPLPDASTHLAELGALERAVLGAVAAYYHLEARTLLSRTRTQDVTEARQVAMALLARRGLCAAAIGRVLQRDHSTVLHGLGRLDAARAAVVDQLAGTLSIPPVGGWTRERQEAALAYACLGLPAGEDVAHYLVASVLGWRRVEPDRTRRALLLLAAHPWVVRSCTRLLSQVGLAPFGTILQRQLAAFGARRGSWP